MYFSGLLCRYTAQAPKDVGRLGRSGKMCQQIYFKHANPEKRRGSSRLPKAHSWGTAVGEGWGWGEGRGWESPGEAEGGLQVLVLTLTPSWPCPAPRSHLSAELAWCCHLGQHPETTFSEHLLCAMHFLTSHLNFQLYLQNGCDSTGGETEVQGGTWPT